MDEQRWCLATTADHFGVCASEQLKHLPFLLITAEARKENIIDAAQAGADGYIVKPFTVATLREKIEAILQRKGLA